MTGVIHVVKSTNKTVHAAEERNGWAALLCGGRYRIGQSCEIATNARLTCRRCMSLAERKP